MQQQFCLSLLGTVCDLGHCDLFTRKRPSLVSLCGYRYSVTSNFSVRLQCPMPWLPLRIMTRTHLSESTSGRALRGSELHASHASQPATSVLHQALSLAELRMCQVRRSRRIACYRFVLYVAVWMMRSRARDSSSVTGTRPVTQLSLTGTGACREYAELCLVLPGPAASMHLSIALRCCCSGSLPAALSIFVEKTIARPSSFDTELVAMKHLRSHPDSINARLRCTVAHLAGVITFVEAQIQGHQ